MTLGPGLLEEVLDTLGRVLQSRGHGAEIVVSGGGGLLLLGLITRPTKDLDVLALVGDTGYGSSDPLPGPLVEAARDVGGRYGLAQDWLNAGPTSTLDFGLPPGFEQRVETRTYSALIVHLAGRVDQICFKLYAVVDQGLRSKHAQDLDALVPTTEELLFAARWTLTQDPSAGFRRVLLETLRALGVDDADAQLS